MKDKEIEKLIGRETRRQKEAVNLIASENYASDDVLKALGSALTNKYAEGYPGNRYYGGNKITDEIENLAKRRALELFNLSEKKWHINVQPLSGSPANLAVYLALVPQGDLPAGRQGKIMGMELSHGGHLTHGHKVSISGQIWRQVPYGVDKKTEILNYDALKKLAKKERPAIIVSGYTAYPRFINWKKMKTVANAGGSVFMVDMSHIAGLVAGGAYPSPFPYADVVTATTHKTLRGPRAAIIFIRKDDRELWKKIDKAVFPGVQGGPHLNQIAAVAVALKEANTPAFKNYAKQVVKNAKALAEELSRLGWRLVSRGTDTHLILLDTFARGISGKEASERLEQAGIIVNKNAIPFDTRGPMDPSGIRLGTAAETTRGKKEKDMIVLAGRIDAILRGYDCKRQKNRLQD